MSIDTHSAILALAALGHASRMDIFRYLLQAGPAGRLAGTIGKELDIPPSTLSFHLRELRQAGLIAAMQVGRTRHYSVQASTLRPVLSFLSGICCTDPAHPACSPLAGSKPVTARGRARRNSVVR